MQPPHQQKQREPNVKRWGGQKAAVGWLSAARAGFLVTSNAEASYLLDPPLAHLAFAVFQVGVKRPLLLVRACGYYVDDNPFHLGHQLRALGRDGRLEHAIDLERPARQHASMILWCGHPEQ
jgi:hypothetical protein